MLTRALTVAAVAMGAYHLIAVQYLLQSQALHYNTHLAFSLLIVWLDEMRTRGRRRLTGLLLVVSLLPVTYVHAFFRDVEERAEYMTPNSADIVFGGLLLIGVIEGTRRAWGNSLAVTAAALLLYAYLGAWVPGPFGSLPISWSELVYRMSTSLGGIYRLMGISANFVFLFMLLGGLLNATPIHRLFKHVTNVLARWTRSGPGLAPIATSGLAGMITGYPSANIAITGTSTIPIMKMAGYSAEQAAALEAAAATGAQLMPPVMAATAFVMAGITGISYARIMWASLIPALLFYVSCGIYAHLQALKLNIRPVETEPFDLREVLRLCPLILVPIGLMVVLLVAGFSPMLSAFWSIAGLVTVALLQRETRPPLRQWLAGFEEGAILGARIALSIATIGIVLDLFVLNGLPVKLPVLLIEWTSGSLVLTLVLVMVVNLMLGGPLPTTATYVFMVSTTGPALLRMGVPLLEAHLFNFYYACLSMLTPPVAPSVFVASSLAKSDFWRTSIEQMKPAAIGLIVPFAFVFSPLLVGDFGRTTWSDALVLLALLLLLVALQALFIGHLLRPCSTRERMFLAGSCALAFVALLRHEPLSLAIALFAFGVVVTKQRRRPMRAGPPAAC